MTVNFKTNVRTVIRYKGQEYSSLDQLPAEARTAYETALAQGTTAKPAADKEQIVVNGQRFASPDEMPAAERKLYDDAISLVRDSTTISKTPVSSSSWITPSQWRLAVLLAAFAVLVVWMVRLLH
ncbi:MAG: hypothetical protein ABR611_03920 [Chthoniobacterales bacterium]